MIFVTVGAQIPFDRLVRTVDAWAGRAGRTDVVAQIGPSTYTPQHMRWVQFMDSVDYRAHIADATCVIGHAGMGTIISARELRTPLLVMPRRGSLQETRNDHQVATARKLLQDGIAAVAWDENELLERLDQIDTIAAAAPIASHASFSLLTTLRQFIHPEETGSTSLDDAVAESDVIRREGAFGSGSDDQSARAA